MNIWPFNIPEKRRIAARKRNEEAAKVSVKSMLRTAELDAHLAKAIIGGQEMMTKIVERMARANMERALEQSAKARAEALLQSVMAKCEADYLQRQFQHNLDKHNERMKGKP